MFWVIHILIGMIIGKGFNSPWLIIPIALLSHFALDAIPHWDGVFDTKEFKKTGKARIKEIDVIAKFFDIFFSAILVIFFFHTTPQADKLPMFLGGLVAVLPDMVKGFYVTKLREKKSFMDYLKFHGEIQGKADIKEGIMIQCTFFALFMVIIISVM